jgi:hypothetical protein
MCPLEQVEELKRQRSHELEWPIHIGTFFTDRLPLSVTVVSDPTDLA